MAQKIIILNHGQIQQIGPPSTIYHQPVNTFVAAFVGSPQMNLIEGRLDERGAIFRTEAFEMDLSGVLSGRSSDYAGRPLTVGVRPEDLYPTSPDNAWIRGEIEIVEDLGSDRFAHLRWGSVELVARMPLRTSPKKGELLCLAVEPGRLHLFFEGRRIN